MPAIHFDSQLPDRERRERLFAGELFVYTTSRASSDFVSLARSMITAAFGDLDPRTAQEAMPPEEFARVLADLKPRFIHDERCKAAISALTRELGCDAEATYFDVPRMRTATAHDYLTTGIAYAFHPHRDTWYSAPMMQVNWWIPIYPVEPRNVMTFHPRYWREGVRNGSARYNYYEWNRTGRRAAAAQVGQDTREQPKPEQEIELEPDIRVVPPVGGVLMFSGAQLHSTVPNTSDVTRFSIDFRTLNIGDVRANRAAPNVDSACTGTSMRDFLRVSDLTRIDESLVARYDSGPVVDARDLVFTPD